jgi:radical SAM protein with 4Fe4S-binding SPASM domain
MWRTIQIELHADCNRDCPFCPRFHDRSGVRKDASGAAIRTKMPTDRVLSILDQAYDLGFRGAVGLHRLSEATLDTRFLDVYRYLRKKGMVYQDATNGDVLKRKPDLCAAIDEPETELIIGLYDSTTEEERDAEKAFWRARFKHAVVTFSEPDKNLVVRKSSQVYDLAEKDPAILDMPCYAQDELLIRYDGNVSLCCQDDPCEFDLGNAFERPLEEIWWSEKREQITQTLHRAGGRRLLGPCSTCYAGHPSTDVERNRRILGAPAA